jgi:hypothetical protein
MRERASADASQLDIGRPPTITVALGFTGVEQRENVGVMEVGRELDLLQEPLGAEGGGELRVENLEGDFAVVPQVAGEIDSRHPTGADLTFDFVALKQ